MRVNTGRFLDTYDLQDLTRAYVNAYLSEQGVVIEGVEPQPDRRFNLGELFGGGCLIRASDNSLFALSTSTTMANPEDAAERQVLSNSFSENYLSIISFLIANNYPRLPSSKLKIGMCLNHGPDDHWTLLMANFEGLNQRQYMALYRAYQTYARNNPPSVGDPSTSVAQLQLNHAKNFIMAHKRITLTQRAKNKVKLGNWVLPINARKISLTHYDSMGDSYNENVEGAVRDFTQRHHAEFDAPECEQQSGSTCGDWSVFNAMRFGLLNKDSKAKLPYSPGKFSRSLRALSQNITQDNAAQILYAKKPTIQEAQEEDRVCITQEGRTELAQWNEDERRNRQSQVRERVRQRIRENREHAEDNRRFNNLYPMLSIFSRLALGIMVATSLFWTLSAFLTINAGFALFLAMVGCVASSCFLYDLTSDLFFGKEIVRIELNDNFQPELEDLSEKEGLINLFGLKAPHHKKLHVLESEISSLLKENSDQPRTLSSRQKDKQEKERQVLTHFYARKIIKADPLFFYDADRTLVNQTSYVDKKKAKKLLRTGA